MDSPSPVIFFYTDFGLPGPYLGQMEAAVLACSPEARVVNLMADAPRFLPKPAGYLLASLLPDLPVGSVVVAVVDPGVGGSRRPLAVEVDGRWLVGPDNGLLAAACRQAVDVRLWQVDPEGLELSSSFHGRDLFAPVAAELAKGDRARLKPLSADVPVGFDWPFDLAEIIYIDHYGNAVTGVRVAGVPREARLMIGGKELAYARTFCEVGVGQPFWYENSNGLVEIAVNQGSASEQLGVAIGSPVTLGS